MENAPYDNVEFGPLPTRGGGGGGTSNNKAGSGGGTTPTGTWPGPQQVPVPQPVTLMTQPLPSSSSRPGGGLQPGGKGTVGMAMHGGGTAGSRLAPLQESSAEIAESHDPRMKAVTTQQHASSTAFGSSSTSSSSSSSHQHQRSGVSSSATTGGSSGAAGSGPIFIAGGIGTGGGGVGSSSSNNRTGAGSGSVLTMSAANTTTTASTPIGGLSTTTTAGSSSYKTTASNNKAADSNKAAPRVVTVPNYMPVQVGSGGAKEPPLGFRSSDDDVDFKRHDLDPASRGVLERAYTVHGEFYRLNSKVLDEGAFLKQDVLDIYRKSGEAFSYEQLLQGMLEDGEMLLLGGCWLHYMHVEFKDEAGEKSVRQPYGKGRLCLTNHRVLLLSTDTYTDANLDPYGDMEKKGGYKLEVSKRYTVVFRNLPLTCFHSADLEVNIGTSSQTKITAKSAPCCGLCSCFGVACCNVRWHSTPPMTRSFNERVVRMGLTLPPWGARSTLVLHLDPGQSLTTARDFIAQLHQHSPNMH